MPVSFRVAPAPFLPHEFPTVGRHKLSTSTSTLSLKSMSTTTHPRVVRPGKMPNLLHYFNPKSSKLSRLLSQYEVLRSICKNLSDADIIHLLVQLDRREGIMGHPLISGPLHLHHGSTCTGACTLSWPRSPEYRKSPQTGPHQCLSPQLVSTSCPNRPGSRAVTRPQSKIVEK